ncbi:MAG: DUF502 domain-containing protein [Pseudomonadota bacterium]
MDDHEPHHKRPGLIARLRNYLLTGLVVTGPIGITLYLTWSIIQWIDGLVKPLIPRGYNPDTYLPIEVPGVGLIAALIGLIIIGFLTANLVGRSILGFGESLVDQTPLVRNLYRGLKQIFETALSQKGQSFQRAGMVEYPRKGIWAIVFISTDARGEILEKAGDSSQPMVSVFLPTTPNPTSGFLLFVPREDVHLLDMSVEDAAKLVISAGLVMPDDLPAKEAARKQEREPVAAE